MGAANIQINPVTVTWGTTDLGLCEGDIEISFDEKLLEIKAHQTGEQILAAIRTAKNVSIKMTIQETHKANLKAIFGQAGESLTPTSGTEVTGWGSSTNSVNVLTSGQKLVLHPVGKGSTDYAEDLCFWIAYLNVNSIKFSGEKQEAVEVQFKIYPDSTKDPKVDLFVYGDHTQDLSAP